MDRGLTAYANALQETKTERLPLRHCATCDHVSGKHLMNYAKRWQDSDLGRCDVGGCNCQQWREGERK